jgi:hypothetical protein
MERALRRCHEEMQAAPWHNISWPNFFDTRTDVLRPRIICGVRRDRNRPVVDRHEVYLKVQLERGFDQPATGSSRAAKQVRTIEFQV